MIKLKKINLYHLEFPLKNYVVASFGFMKSRPALILELTDTNDNIGLGEIWCNFPSDGASYKFKLFKNIFVNKLINSNIEFDINGSVEKRIPNNLNIAIKGKVAEQLFNFMPHIALSSGSACTSGIIERSHVLTAMKLDEDRIDGSFRISVGRNTTKEEIIDLIGSIEKNV